MQYTVEKKIDYLSYTLKIPRIYFDKSGTALSKSPNPNYDMCELADSGGLHLWSTTNDKVGHHYIYSGSSLDWLRQHGIHEKEMVVWALENASISRIDLAVTSHPNDAKAHHGFTPHAIAWACRDGLLKSRLKPDKDVVSDMKTETKYIGSRKARNRLFRAYDKGIERGLVTNWLVRYELETRKGTKTIARAIRDDVDYGAIIRKYVDFPQNPTWLQIMGQETAKMKHTDEILSSSEKSELARLQRWQWLIDSIPKTIEKALREDKLFGNIEPRENEHFHDFVRTIMSKLDIV